MDSAVVEATGLPITSASLPVPLTDLPAFQADTKAASTPQALAIPRALAVALALSILTVGAVAVHGYHPFAEDAGIYIAGIKLALNPALYPASTPFITAHTQLSIFSTFIASLTRIAHLPLDYVLFTLYVATTWLTLFGCWALARRCFPSSHTARWSAVLLLASTLTLPIAGTSLFLMDPYLTGRSFSTPFILLAICACLDRRPLLTVLALAAAAAFHPLMAIYAAGFLLLLWAATERRWITAAVLCSTAIALGAALQFSQRNVTESPAYLSAVLTRSYFYLSAWQWYEWIGLAAPLLMMLAYIRWQQLRPRTTRTAAPDLRIALSAACILSGLTAIAVSALFAHQASHSHLVARLQVLRMFHIIYLVFFVLLGGVFGQYALKRAAWRWAISFTAIATTLFFVQRATYSASTHIEAPWREARNPWTQAFLWIRSNTPVNALFALDADYIYAPQEDTQGFRAIAERGSLADYSKDGGASAIFPQLAPAWAAQHTATAHLNTITDSQRLQKLAPFHVTWLVLDRNAQTSFDCPYMNQSVKVCRLPQQPAVMTAN